MEKLLEKELQKRGLKSIPYQVDYLTNPIYLNPKKYVVLGAGTSAGKTKTTILELQLFYSNKINENKLTLIVPASKTILRDNFENDLNSMNEQEKLSFNYRVVKDKKDIEQALTDKVQVIVCLPQTLLRNYKLLPKLEKFVLDEAHQWYFKKTIQNILKHTKPNKVLLLTGTPSRFIENGDFIFKFVPVMELYELGLVSNVKVEVVSSSYDFKRTDWFGAFGHLKEGKTNSKKQAGDALLMVCNEMLKKLKNPIKGLHSINNITNNGVGKLFNSLSKTIIYTHSRKQATNFHNTLSQNKDLKGRVLLSHSENDKDSKEFEKFQNNSEYLILIAVDRGRLGFNMPELFNIVDFTMTQSLDMLLQMYGRLLRKSDLQSDKTKTYFKVATKNTADYFVDLMTAMLCLTNIEWYSKYNGKNMGGIRIPKVLNGRRNNQSRSDSSTTSSTNRRTRPYVSIEELGIPMDLNFFKQDIFHSSNSLFNTVAWTTLNDVRNEFLDVTYTIWDEKMAQDFIKNNNLTELTELKKMKGGFGLYHWLNKNNLTEKFFGESKTKSWTIKSAKEFVKKHNAEKLSDLRDYFKGSGLINWIIKNDLTFTFFPESKDIEWTEKTAKDFIKENRPINFTHLSKMGSKGSSLQRWIYLYGGGRKKYFNSDEKIYWTDDIAKEFITKHKPRVATDLKKIKGGSGLLGWLSKNKKTTIFFPKLKNKN